MIDKTLIDAIVYQANEIAKMTLRGAPTYISVVMTRGFIKNG